jgi:hypothetical protein
MVEKSVEFLDDPHDIWKYKDLVVSKIPIVGLAKEYGLVLESKNVGAFTYRACCPIHHGKGANGKERTPSLFFSEEQNSFCCFGCGLGGSVVEFVSLIEGTPASIAMTKLAKRAGLMDKDGKWDELQLAAFVEPAPFDPMKTVEPYVFEISLALRSHVRKFIDSPMFEMELIWMERVAAKADRFLGGIGHEDWEYAKELCSKVKGAIKDRERKREI